MARHHERRLLGLTASAGLYRLADIGALAVNARRLAFVAVGVVAVQAVFDVSGGTWLMPKPRPAVTDFLRGWACGVFVHTLVLAGVGLLSYAEISRQVDKDVWLLEAHLHGEDRPPVDIRAT